MTEDTFNEYVEKLKALLPMAQKAYGPKDQKTPAHEASRQYTEILVEFYKNDGSLVDMANRLGVSYSGLRRRVFTSNVPTLKNEHGRRKLGQEQIDEAIARVKEARAISTVRYHEQLATEYYQNGVSLTTIAKGLNISNAAPLYYGIQRHILRLEKFSSK